MCHRLPVAGTGTVTIASCVTDVTAGTLCRGRECATAPWPCVLTFGNLATTGNLPDMPQPAVPPDGSHGPAGKIMETSYRAEVAGREIDGIDVLRNTVV